MEKIKNELNAIVYIYPDNEQISEFRYNRILDYISIIKNIVIEDVPHQYQERLLELLK